MLDSKNNLEEFNNVNEVDLDFITGGAKVDKNILQEKNYKETFNSQKCNCNSFESSIGKSSLNICDNCVWARSPREGSIKIYCMKQPLKETNS